MSTIFREDPNTEMARLAADRKTHLTPAEIAREALRQFDAGPREPSIRSLAAALHVTPTAIYHHFPSQAAIYQAAVELVWNESLPLLLEIEPRPLEADPADTLVAVGLATRRAWLAHYRVAHLMAATPQANEFNETRSDFSRTCSRGSGSRARKSPSRFTTMPR